MNTLPGQGGNQVFWILIFLFSLKQERKKQEEEEEEEKKNI